MSSPKRNTYRGFSPVDLNISIIPPPLTSQLASNSFSANRQPQVCGDPRTLEIYYIYITILVSVLNYRKTSIFPQLFSFFAVYHSCSKFISSIAELLSLSEEIKNLGT